MTGVGIPQENWRINEIYSCEKYQTNSNYCCGVFQLAICAYQRAVFFLGGKGRRPAVHEVWKSFSRTSASMLKGRFITGCMRKIKGLLKVVSEFSDYLQWLIQWSNPCCLGPSSEPHVSIPRLNRDASIAIHDVTFFWLLLGDSPKMKHDQTPRPWTVRRHVTILIPPQSNKQSYN